MEDAEIIALYWERKEEAIRETDGAYGRRLQGLSYQILRCYEDAQESVNDTYWKTWDAIPPQRPNCFFAFLAKICRNLSLNRLEWNQAAKRSATVLPLTAELEQCIPDRSLEWELESQELAGLLNRFLGSLSVESRLIFLRRYWYADSVSDIARRYRITQSKVKTQLHRTRNRLRCFLEQEGVAL